jgi:hypothetical protein
VSHAAATLSCVRRVDGTQTEPHDRFEAASAAKLPRPL